MNQRFAWGTILAVIDGAVRSSPALRRAAALAQASGAALHLCLFDHDHAIDAAARRLGAGRVDAARREFAQDRLQGLERLAVGLAGRGHPVEIDVVWAPRLPEAILAKMLQIGAGLVVKDAHRESPVLPALFTPQDRRLARLLPCELWFAGTDEHDAPRRILAAVDVLAEPAAGGALNRRVLEAALRLAEYADATVEVAAALPFMGPYGEASPAGAELRVEAHSAFDEAYEAFMQRHQVPPERRHRLAGYPSAVLRKCALELGSDLVVAGANYRDGLERLLLGSTAEALLDQSAFDVLLVKGPEFASTLADHVDLNALVRRHLEQQGRVLAAAAAG